MKDMIEKNENLKNELQADSRQKVLMVTHSRVM